MEFTRRVYEDGKITIPKELRDLHGIAEGDFVRLQIVEIRTAPRPPLPTPASALGAKEAKPKTNGRRAPRRKSE